MRLSEDERMEAVCPNCKSDWIQGDRYCRFCGAPMNQPGYKIRNFACIYGPEPRLRKHECPQCHYSWETNQMIDREKYCPRCGAEAEVQTED